ncbi:MAG: hypothetical protein ACTHM7_15445 [Ginsengibacter sp.]
MQLKHEFVFIVMKDVPTPYKIAMFVGINSPSEFPKGQRPLEDESLPPFLSPFEKLRMTKGRQEQSILILNDLFGLDNTYLVRMIDLYPVCPGGFIVEFITISIGIQRFTKQHFRRCVLVFDDSHIRASYFFGMDICHEAKVVPPLLSCPA